MSSEQIIQFYGMAEGGVVEDVKAEVGDDTFVGDKTTSGWVYRSGNVSGVT